MAGGVGGVGAAELKTAPTTRLIHGADSNYAHGDLLVA